jgi:Sulfotransferase family
MPNFLVIGAAKSGTTALHHYLAQHPEIFVSNPKEIRFFPFENQNPTFCGPTDHLSVFVTKIEDYVPFFEAAADYRARGESSPVYLYYPRAAERIQHHIPNAKLIVILRHPADRAYSHYLMLRRDGVEPLTFPEAIAAEDQRVSDGWAHHWHFRRRGYYASQLKPYFDIFKREQLRIHLFEDFVSDARGVLQDIFRFLDVDDTFVPDTSLRHNESRLPRSPALHGFLTQSRTTKNLLKPLVPFELRQMIRGHIDRRNLVNPPPLTKELRRDLIEVYREDILELQTMLQRDLSHWLK